MEDDNDDSTVTIEEDYYTFLNVPRNASNEEIINAYRRLSILYHPDKHVDPVRKKDAELLFHKVKKAYEGLSFSVACKSVKALDFVTGMELAVSQKKLLHSLALALPEAIANALVAQDPIECNFVPLCQFC
ncbi:DnaJ (Hsp40), sub C, member 11 [Homalodisca vitripennis]|nr:DnaJ (Hsp40), sub C, member 11 [Homalodisca vitripennis]